VTACGGNDDHVADARLGYDAATPVDAAAPPSDAEPRADAAPFSCDSLTDDMKGLFELMSVAGASNSITTGCTAPCGPLGPGDYEGYAGKLLTQVWSVLDDCVAYDPELWIRHYAEVANCSADTTFFFAADAFNWYVGDAADVADFRGLVEGYLDTLGTVAPDAPFIGANVATPTMGDELTQEEKDQYNLAMAEELAERGYEMLDLDAVYAALLDGRVTYGGEVIGREDLFVGITVHFNDLGHQFTADLFIQRLNELYPGFNIPLHADIEIAGE
jgi:hypothetical protein